LVYVPVQVADEVTCRVETTGRIETALTDISAVNLELLARGELD